jgi:hypothetical protein
VIAQLAKMLGLSRDHAEASMHSERAARAVLTRRNLFAAGGALASGAAFSFAAAEPAGFWVQNIAILSFGEWTDITITLGDGTTLRFPKGEARVFRYEGPVGLLGERIELQVQT